VSSIKALLARRQESNDTKERERESEPVRKSRCVVDTKRRVEDVASSATARKSVDELSEGLKPSDQTEGRVCDESCPADLDGKGELVRRIGRARSAGWNGESVRLISLLIRLMNLVGDGKDGRTGVERQLETAEEGCRFQGGPVESEQYQPEAMEGN
jgi:hypothetical protein